MANSALMTVSIAVLGGVVVMGGLKGEAANLKSDGNGSPDVTPRVIYYNADASPSVGKTAREIQKYVKAVYNVELPLVTNRTDAPMICVGNNEASAAAGFSGATLPYESGRIVAANGNLYIFGHDVADDARLASDGWSLGTWHAGLTFIEKVLGVKFLMPGEFGTYIPSKTGPLSFAGLDMVDSPKFVFRWLSNTGRTKSSEWLEHQRYNYRIAGGSVCCSFNENWPALFPQPGDRSAKRLGDAMALYEKHPEYFRMFAGVRQKPDYDRFFMCVTAPGFIEEVVRRVGISYQIMTNNICSISGNDGGDWCQCSKCAAFYDSGNPYFPDEKKTSRSRYMLTYYNRVAERVAEQYPGKAVAGLLYAQYATPPVPPMKLAGNLYLSWAPTKAYGPLSSIAFRDDSESGGNVWKRIATDWTKCATNIVYHSYDFWVRQYAGVPLPPFRILLKGTFPVLHQNGWLGFQLHGNSGQSLQNYLQAKLSWNPDLDIDATISEYCRSAYGKGGPDIEKMYDLIEDGFVKYALVNKKHKRMLGYDFSPRQLNDIYAQNWPEITRLFESAWNQAVTPGEKWRLEQLKKMLQTTQYTLAAMGMVQVSPDSMFFLDDQQYLDLVSKQDDFIYQPASSKYLGNVLKKLEVKSGAGASAPVANTNYALFLHRDFLIVPEHDQEVTLEVVGLDKRAGDVASEFPYYELHDNSFKVLRRGLLKKGKLTFNGEKGRHYFFTYLPIGEFTTYQIKCDAPWAFGNYIQPQGILFRAALPAALDFYVPDEVDAFALTLVAMGSRTDRVSGNILSPDNKVIQTFKKVGLQEISVKKPAEQGGGFWRIVFDDQRLESEYYIRTGDNLAGYFFLGGNDRFSVRLK